MKAYHVIIAALESCEVWFMIPRSFQVFPDWNDAGESRSSSMRSALGLSILCRPMALQVIAIPVGFSQRAVNTEDTEKHVKMNVNYLLDSCIYKTLGSFYFVGGGVTSF